LLAEQSVSSVSAPLLIVLIFWLTILFISFGLFAPRNATVVVSLLVSALSVSDAILLILDMYTPYSGLIQVSSAPPLHISASSPEAQYKNRTISIRRARRYPALKR